MEKVYRENEGKPENEGNLDNEGKPEDEVQPENEGESNEKEKLEVERKSEQEPEVQNERKPDNEGQPADEGKQEKQGKSEAEGNPLMEGKLESQAKPESQSHAAKKRPAEDYVPRKAKRKTDRTTEDSPPDYMDLIPELGRSPGRGHNNPLRCSCLENPHGQRSLSDTSEAIEDFSHYSFINADMKCGRMLWKIFLF
uniref:Transcription elongation factor A protein-like 5 n=1 Tax=Moschus moschiferus TaxID=68415 RepID=A0A8C6CH59_MOSMO